VVLILLAGVDLSLAVARLLSNAHTAPVDFVSPISRIVTYSLAATFLALNRVQGMQTSGVVFMFWFLHSVFGALTMRSHLLRLSRGEEPWTAALDVSHRSWPDDSPLHVAVVWVISYPLIVLLFLLNCFADRPPKLSLFTVKVEVSCTEKNDFVTATKLGTTNNFFGAATKNFAAATNRFVDRNKHLVVVTKYFCYPYFNK